MKFMTWRNAGTLFLLLLPILGLWLFLDAIYQGPNHFGSRVVVIESLEFENITLHSPRFGPAGKDETIWRILYRYTDSHGKVQHGRKVLRSHDPKPWTLKTGDQLFTRISVAEDEGGLGLNLRAEQGLSLILIFGLMALWPIGSFRWRENSKARHVWYQAGAAVLGLTAVILMNFS